MHPCVCVHTLILQFYVKTLYMTFYTIRNYRTVSPYLGSFQPYTNNVQLQVLETVTVRLTLNLHFQLTMILNFSAQKPPYRCFLETLYYSDAPIIRYTWKTLFSV